MHTLSFHSLDGAFKSKLKIKQDKPYEKIFEELGIKSKFIFYQNLMYGSHEYWNNLTRNEDFREQLYKSKLLFGEHNINLIIIGGDNADFETPGSERLLRVIESLNALEISYCIKEVARNISFLFELFCRFNTNYKNFDSLNNDELYYYAVYLSFQLLNVKKSLFIKSMRKFDPCFDESSINIAKVYQLFRQACSKLCRLESNHFRGLSILALFYKADKNYDAMELFYLEAIRRGDFVISLQKLAEYYRDVTKNYEKMEALYETGKKNGSFTSMNQLAIYYGTTRSNRDLMLKNFKFAQKCGSIYATYGIGHYFYFTIEKNYEKMKEMYLIAIEYGIPNAMNDLAYYYEIVCKDYPNMEKYYKMAADKYNYLYSMNNLAVYYKNIKKDYDQMKIYVSMGIGRGCRYSMYTLALYFHKIEPNEDLMIKYYEMSYRFGYSEAYYMLGLYFQHDKKNYEQMKKYYNINIEKNKCTKSMIKIAVYYFDMEQNTPMAINFINMAIKYKNPLGYYYLALISGINGNMEEMIKNHKIAIKRGVVESMHDLGVLLARSDNPEYLEYYLMAIEKGSNRSLTNLIGKLFKAEMEYIFKKITSWNSLPDLLGSKAENEFLGEMDDIPQDISLDNLKKALKLILLQQKRFGDYNFRMFIINHYLRSNVQKSIPFLKKFTLVNRIDPNIFDEYQQFKKNEFQTALFSNHSFDLSFNFTR